MATIVKRGKRWRVQVRRQGAPSISRTFTSKRDAEVFAAGLEHDVLTRRYIPVRGGLILREALERYFDEVSSKKKGHAQEARRIRQWQDSPFATLTLDNVSPKALSEWRDEQLQTRAPATVRLSLAILSHLYTVASKEWGVVVDNPVRQITLPSTKGNARTRRLQKGEYRRLIRAGVHPDLPDFIRLAVLTGMRRGELCALRWQDLDLDHRVAVLPTTKNSERRVVPLSRRAIKVLRSRWDSVSARRVFPLDPNRYSIAFVAACRRAGVADLTLHDLRHEATSRFFEKGLSIVEVASITGHKSLSMLKRYTHPRVDTLADKLG